jgi:hypothetical protein
MAKITVLHIGLHKTASTSFQRTCELNREAILAAGFCYPALETGNRKLRGNHSVPFFNAFSASRAAYHMNAGMSMEEISAESEKSIYKIREALLGKERVIFSGEDVSDLSEKDQMNLRIYLGARSRKLVVIGLVRSPYSLHCSAYSAMTIRRRISLDPAKLLTQRKKIEKAISSFGKMLTLYPFDEAISEQGGPTIFLLKKAGIDPSRVPITLVRANSGPSNSQTRALMRTGIDLKKINLDNAKFCSAGDKAVSGPKFLLGTSNNR